MRRVMRALAPTAAAALAVFAFVSWVGAGEDQAARARKIVTDIASEHAAPALSGAASGGTPKEAFVAADPAIAEAKKMLARAEELRRLGDVPRAEIAEDAALEWAETARAMLDAVKLEKSAANDETQAAIASAKADKARAALDEAIARRAKLAFELDQLDAELAQKALDAGSDAGSKTKKSKGSAP